MKIAYGSKLDPKVDLEDSPDGSMFRAKFLGRPCLLIKRRHNDYVRISDDPGDVIGYGTYLCTYSDVVRLEPGETVTLTA